MALGCQDVATVEKSTEVYRKANSSMKYAVTRLRALRRVTAQWESALVTRLSAGDTSKPCKRQHRHKRVMSPMAKVDI